MDGFDDEQVRMTPYQVPMHQWGGSMITLTDPSDELRRMELTLRNAVENEDGQVVLLGDPLLNDEGINRIMGMVRNTVSRITFMSNVKDNDIMMLMDFLGDTLAKDLMVNRMRYGIKDGSARDTIFFNILTPSFISLRRAFEEGDKRFWKGSTQEITNRLEGQQQGGLWNSLRNWGK